MATPRKILVTSALPYANGPIHVGHLVEYIQTDIWARFQRLRGHRCLYVCADDAHGTPIMLRAREDGVPPEELIERFHREHTADFKGFHVAFDNYYTTHSPENRALSERIYRALREAGHIRSRTIRQLYDPEHEMFLPDRYIRGSCPRCNSADQYGDSCERCGATYEPGDLKEAVSVLSGKRPEERESEHYFFDLPAFETGLRDWIRHSKLQSEVANKLNEWFEAGLREWDISRDAPYFGFRIPDTQDKYFYVWLDAPIGYLASLKQLCEREELDFEAFLRPGSDTELYHFIGKDIVYFHGLFWPALLQGSGLRVPDALCVHGFLTVNGQKMSKSRGTFITARDYLHHLDPEYLRYYFAYRLDSSIGDIDLNLDDFVQRVNSDLVGKVVNIASRCARFIGGRHGGRLAGQLHDPTLFERLAEAGATIAKAYEEREYSMAMREIMHQADAVNRYVDRHKPWERARQPGTEEEVHAVCTQGLNGFRQLMTYLKPVLPATAKRSEAFLGIDALRWDDAQMPLLDCEIRRFEPLFRRVAPAAVEAVLEEARLRGAIDAPDANANGNANRSASADHPRPRTDANERSADTTISIDEFARLDLQVACILKAETVAGADRLLRLQLDLGGERRSVLAGIREAYTPEQLTGRLVAAIVNLAPRKTRFGVSEAMILAAGGPGGERIFLLSPDSGAEPGMKIR